MEALVLVTEVAVAQADIVVVVEMEMVLLEAVEEVAEALVTLVMFVV